MNYLIFDIISYFIISNNDLDLIKNLRCVSSQFKNKIDSDKLYIRKKYAFILTNVISKIGLPLNDYFEIIDDKNDYKYILNIIYNIYTKNDSTYFKYHYANKFNKFDKLNPLRNIPIFKSFQIKQRMKNSILLNMALTHAEYYYSIKKARELDDYY